MSDARIVQRVVVNGTLVLRSPMRIGSGAGAETDHDIIRTHDGAPFIPGHALAGAMRSALLRQGGTAAADAIFGGGGDTAVPSPLCVDDAVLIPQAGSPGEGVTAVRDGVAIDRSTRVAAPKRKYDFEVLESGRFELNLELVIRGRDAAASAVLLQGLDLLLDLLRAGEIHLGARTRRGLGRVALEDDEIRHFDFADKLATAAWLLDPSSLPHQAVARTDRARSGPGRDVTVFEVECALAGSLLIRVPPPPRPPGDGPPAREPDAVHATWQGEPVLYGTSLAGALRARADRIAKTVLGADHGDDEHPAVTSLFGFVSKDAQQASRIRFDEAVVSGVQVGYQQTRVRIDRLTGGASESALFQEVPVWPMSASRVTIRFAIERSTDAELGLMLLVLKDLCTGDLPIGGGSAVGRGLLAGRRTHIARGETRWEWSQSDKGDLTFGNGSPQHGEPADLEQWVAAFLASGAAQPGVVST